MEKKEEENEAREKWEHFFMINSAFFIRYLHHSRQPVQCLLN